MSYRFKKNEFFISLFNNIITVTQNNSLERTSFAIALPGNLYMLVNGQWVLIDINAILPFNIPDYLERAATAMILSLSKTSLLMLTEKERKFLINLVRSLVANKKTIPEGDYYLNSFELVSTNNVKYDLTDDGVAIIRVLPQLVITPPSTKYTSGFVMGNNIPTINPVTIQTRMVQQTPPPFQLPPVKVPINNNNKKREMRKEAGQIIIPNQIKEEQDKIRTKKQTLDVKNDKGKEELSPVVSPILPRVMLPILPPILPRIVSPVVPPTLPKMMVASLQKFQTDARTINRSQLSPPASPYLIRPQQLQPIEGMEVEMEETQRIREMQPVIRKELPVLLKLPTKPIQKPISYEQDPDWFNQITATAREVTTPPMDEELIAMDEAIDNILPKNLGMLTLKDQSGHDSGSDDEDTIEDPDLQGY